MQTDKIVMEGLGGQGVLSAGKFLGFAAVKAGLEVTFSPSYGAEVRGGLSHCDLVISDQPVKSFIVEKPTTMILMSAQAWENCMKSCPDDCVVIANSSLAETEDYKGSARIIRIPASRIADDIGNPRVANCVMVGAYLGLRKTFDVDFIADLLPEFMPANYQKTIPHNAEALKQGWKLVAEKV
ncbi:MAG: 2-oxoacid:acceptor oxidoreductase family protein [Planctomycetota bacterium]|jgi:2-oxoglutarate ferredoxin oxidoreductase subunit gamma